MNTTLRQILTTAAAVGVLTLAGAAPASAEHEPGHGPITLSREGFVDDADLTGLRTGLGATFGLVLLGAGAAGARRSLRGRGVADQPGELDPAARPGLA